MQLTKAALKRLTQQHADVVRHNELIGNLKKQLENDILLTTQQLNVKECDDSEQATLEQYNRVFKDLIQVQRRELFRLSKQEGYEDEVIRKHEAQMDLDEERLSM